ncbi:MAG: thioredoxin-dependent thiol peroxidase [Flavobacteriia bacterium]|nr:thioredoxin-dependent thiol peroxidase [Flavobacteriia bacterium]
MSNLKFLKIGDKAPMFIGKNQNGDNIYSSDLIGKKWAIYFYPKDSTPGCTMQACNIRDNYSTLSAKGITIIGVSADSESSHQRFIEKQNLPFVLIADIDRTIIEAYGVWGNKKFMGREYDGIHRTTFVVNEKGIIVGIIEKPKTKAHAEEIIEIIENN